MMTTPARPFLDMYHNNITELKRNFMTYVKGLRATSATPSDVTPSRLQLTKDRFPILPALWKGSEYKKKELEEWFKLYVGQHYSMVPCYFHKPLLISLQNLPTMAELGRSHTQQLVIKCPYSSIPNISQQGSNGETQGTCRRVLSKTSSSTFCSGKRHMAPSEHSGLKPSK